MAAESPVTLPWDKGCWPTVFGKHSNQFSRQMAFKRALPPVVFHDPEDFSSQDVSKKSKPQKLDATSWMQIIRCVNEESWTELRDSQFQVALKRWLDVALCLPASCGLVMQLSQLGNTAEQLRMMRDLFHKKAPQTLLKRCHSFLHFVEHLKETGDTFPGTELGFYRYLCSLKDAGAPTSKVQSVVQALNFAQHVVGLVELSPLTSSKRCVGACGVRNTGPKKQASPFSVKEILSLHSVLHDTEEDLWTRAFAGTVLLAIYSRSRWSDLQHAESMTVDCDVDNRPVYAELQISSHKCRESAAFRNTFLVAVAPSLGVATDPWLPAWLEVRAALNIDFKLGMPTLPAPNSDAFATKRPVGTDEMKKWTHMILKQRGHDMLDRRITSHSCKCTVLSWLAKRGDDWTDRMALGGHVTFMKSAIVYSRDAMSRPVRVLESLLKDVRLGIFCPDETRSGRFREEHMELSSQQVSSSPRTRDEQGWTLLGHTTGSSLASNSDKSFELVEIADSDEEQVKQEETGNTDSDSDALTTSSSEDEAGAAKSGAARPMRLPTVPDELKLMQHTKYKTLHLMEKQNFRVMLCGRTVIEGRYAPADSARFDTPCCHTCWKHKPEYER